MSGGLHRVLFDPPDYELLNIVNEVRGREKRHRQFKSLFTPNLHPNGIKEMAAPKDLRVAYAVIHLLDSLQAGRSRDRLDALRAVREEVMHCSQSHLRINTGRVLVQIMKELIRAHGHPDRQLKLAHDFRLTSTGKPLVVRRQLKQYHLLEMPEDWSQLTFDDHVHDANTKGRKFPTHLVLDAWIKGIRSLTVIYYNYIPPAAVSELLEAAKIMEIKVRVGLELSSLWQGRIVNLIWSPRGFSGAKDFVAFLERPEVARLMARGKEVSLYQQGRVLQALAEFNQRGRERVREDLGVDMPTLNAEDFLEYVGSGQASLLHLSQYIHEHLLNAMQSKVRDIRRKLAEASSASRAALAGQVTRMDGVLPGQVAEHYLTGPRGKPFEALCVSDDALPELVRHTPGQLLDILAELHTGARVTLNLSGLSAPDILELIHECKGGITHLEVFNLKDYVGGKHPDLLGITRLQAALNSGNAIILKKCIRDLIARVEAVGDPAAAQQAQRLRLILHHIVRLGAYYRHAPLGSRLGSDSTGRSSNSPGMGLAVLDTLPRRVRRDLRRGRDPQRRLLPVLAQVHQEVAFLDCSEPRSGRRNRLGWLRRLPGLEHLGLDRVHNWRMERLYMHQGAQGNLVSLGGGFRAESNGLRLEPTPSAAAGMPLSWNYLNTGLKNLIKVLLGFVPAALTFGLTHDWWVLAFFGAPIWLAITGARNILQSVLGGGGIRRSPMMRWNNYVSWSRLADSLMFTGWSVPLLDWLVKTVILDHGLDITTHTAPGILYAAISLANGAYISTHNFLRGLSRAAIIGNMFRSLLAIPLAVGLNAMLGGILGIYGVLEADQWLQRGAAVISKAASDCVAGVIEGLADRAQNLRMRAWDYTGKLGQLLEAYAGLEVLFPEEDVSEMLLKPKRLLHHPLGEARHYAVLLTIHALDLMYFWMYQPRARTMFMILLPRLSPEETLIFGRCQLILSREREISQLFVDGLVGKRFSRPLSFYLQRWNQYLSTCDALIGRREAECGGELF